MTSTNNLSVGSEAEADTDCNDKESYTSLSAEEGSDEEWIAEGIIAEGKIDGETRYLVEWTGFPIKDATWEPRSHVEGVLTKQWEEQKKLQKQGRAEKFDLARWTAGWVQELQAKYERHERRNQARARLGNAPSVWSLTLEENIKQTAEFYPNSESRDDDSSSEEDVPWDKLDRPSGLVPTNRPKSPTSRLQSPETSQSTTTFGIQSQPRGDTGVADSPPSSTEPAKAATGAIIKSTITVLTRPPAHTADSDSKATTAARTQQPRADGVRQLLAGSKPIKAKPTAVKSGSSTKRTGTAAPTQGVSSNIFIQGKKQRSRANLYTASSDLSRKAQLLNHRHRRKLELQRRDRENDAPPRMPKNLISLDPNQRTVENTEGTNPPGAVTIQPISSASPHETVPMAVEGSVMPMLKKKKFVQFDELKNSYHESVEMDQNLVEATFETTTMDYEQTTSREPNLFFRDRDDELPLPREKARPPTPPRSSSRSPNQPNIQTTLTPSQDVAKRCLLGTEGRSISLVFKIAPHCPHPWLSNFKTRDKVIFSHVCVAQDFLQLWKVGENARQYDLASGYISCPTESIDHVVDRLKLNSQGIMSRAEGYYILCIPNKSEEWDSMAVNGTHSDGLPFRFVVFQPAGDLSAFFAPNPQKTLDRETQDSQKETMIKRGLTKFLSLNYAKLIPRAMQDSKEHQFFLAFPVADNYAEETRFMTQWLDSSSTATCCIYSGETPGAWREFVDGGRTGSGGIIILHEDTMWHVRLFPNMFAILESNMFPVYVFTRGLQENRLFPSAYTLPARPGILNLEQVFWPGRKAFMLTPSFLLSGPHEAAAFVKWFRATYDKSDNDIGGTGRLVVCSDFAEWLLDLVLNQSANQSHKSHGSEFEAWNQLWRDFADLESRADFVIVAPSSLDGNDEQSLVNWFGFWSLRNMDSVCLCYVLGSISNRWGDMTKRVGPLRFVKGTLFDPNAAEDEFDIHEMNVEFGEQNGALRLIQNESCEEIASFLLRFQFPRGGPKERAPFSFVSVFSRPVSYWKLDIGAALGDREYKFSTFSEWYEYTSYGFKASSNTYGGLFYTIETAWVGQTLLPSQTKRRPWLAFLRPCNPHQRPWETLELFIWDPSYRNSFTGRAEIQEEELIDAQRQLMKLVAGQYRLPLKAVRVGWEDSSNPNGRRSHPMDQCLEMLGNCVHNTWMMLPAPEHSLASHGWVLVTPYDRAQPKKRDESDRPRPDTGASPEAMDIDLELGKGSEKDREENLDNMRVVFHPPRSPLRHHGNSRPSICKNLLVKYLREVEKRTASSNSKYPRGSIFDYRFTPTMVWYDKQIKEGRDFKHMMVAPFDRVFQQLGIQLS